MKRREFITLLGGAAATWPLAASAQQGERIRRIGVLLGYPEGDLQAQANVTALRQGLQSLGWIGGRNVRVDYRWAGADPKKARTFARELIGMTPDVIMPSTNQVTEILLDAPPNVGFLRAAEAAAQSLAVKVIPLPVHNAAEIERGIMAVAAEADGGLIVAPHAVTLGSRALFAELSARHRLPAVYSDRYFAESGGLLSFGNNTADLFRRAASYVDLILKGAKPADLPVQLPTTFELIINLKAAKAIGLDVPWFLQQRADEVIE